MFDATVHGIPHLRPETAARHDRLAREKLAIQPRRTRRGDLLLKGRGPIGRERESLPALGVLVGARLDDRAWRGIAG